MEKTSCLCVDNKLINKTVDVALKCSISPCRLPNNNDNDKKSSKNLKRIESPDDQSITLLKSVKEKINVTIKLIHMRRQWNSQYISENLQ